VNKKYFPPYITLCQAMGISPDAINKPGNVSVPTVLLRYLIKAAIADLQVDTMVYREQNPDIADAFRGRSEKDVEAHYKNVGYFEPRQLPIAFDARFYLRRYPDVEKAVRDKIVANPQQHYEKTGMYEMRLPQAGLDEEVSEWKAIISASRAQIK
jgi:hypothetical protein